MEYGRILVFLAVSMPLGVTALGVNRLLMPFHPNRMKNSTHECGNEPVGDAQIRYNVLLYLFVYTLANVAAALNSVVSLYYYLIVLKRMYITEAPRGAGPLRVSIPVKAVLLLTTVGTFWLGILPGP